MSGARPSVAGELTLFWTPEYDPTGMDFTGTIHGAAESFTGEFVSGNYFTTLGLEPEAGRLLEAIDDRRGAPAVVVAS